MSTLLEILMDQALEDLREPMWRSYDGQRRPVRELEVDHLFNIVKYFLEMNQFPPMPIMQELQNRHLLTHIGLELHPRQGYKSPEEIQALADEQPTYRWSNGSSLS